MNEPPRFELRSPHCRSLATTWIDSFDETFIWSVFFGSFSSTLSGRPPVLMSSSTEKSDASEKTKKKSNNNKKKSSKVASKRVRYLPRIRSFDAPRRVIEMSDYSFTHVDLSLNDTMLRGDLEERKNLER